MAVPFDVLDFAPGVLSGELVARSHEHNAAVADKPQVRFLEAHLATLGCQSMVVEPDYTDRSFLEDYSAYYVRCFEPYGHICTRLHFFDRPLDRDTLSSAIVGDDAASLQDHYLGFIVVKPLPSTVIGRTCLRPPRGDGREFPPIKLQQVDLYGLRLVVETLPFQEQDREVAACASSALWTMLHSTAHLFQHAKPSPVEITKAATMHARVNGRTFPNGDGLNTLQIADAIRAVGLEPSVLAVSSMKRYAIQSEDYAGSQVIPATSEDEDPAFIAKMRMVLKLSVLAYLRSGIACVLLARTSDQPMVSAGDEYAPDDADPGIEHLDSNADDGANTVGTDDLIIPRGNHAVAITGFVLGEDPGEGYGETSTRFTAGRLERIFVHDDQTGPFTSFVFAEGNRLVAENYAAPNVARRLAEPINFVVPLYHKIRIPLSQVLELSVLLDETLGTLPFTPNLEGEIEWDIQLLGLDALRDEFAASELPNALKLDLLTSSLPRYVWRVRAFRKSKPSFDLLLDATDLLQGKLVRRMIPYENALCQQIAAIFALTSKFIDPRLGPVIAAFAKADPKTRATASSATL